MTRDDLPPADGATRSRPLTDDDFILLMAGVGPFEGRPHLACAVSGGADSMALALFAQRWAAGRGGRVTALSVDHGLRRESADEARRVGEWLRPLGIAHHVLAWPGAKPATGVQRAARDARYALLGRWCRDNGVLHLLLGHTRDDQAETLLLRLGAGSGADGLAAMAAVRETPDVRLLRPLLGVSGASLRAALSEHGQPWIEDPSNRDDRFARVRVRRAIAEGGLAPAELARAAGRFGRVRWAMEGAASALLAEAARVHPAGFARLRLAPLAEAPDEVSLRALARTIAAVGGRPYAPRQDRLERLHGRLLGGAFAKGGGATLGGCRLVAELGALLVCRETRGIPEPIPATPGLDLSWDRRFAVRISAAGGRPRRPRLAALGGDGWRDVLDRRPALAGVPLPAAVRPSLPALIDDAGVAAVPHLGYRRADAGGVGFAEIRFSPPNPLASTGFYLPNRPGVLSL